MKYSLAGKTCVNNTYLINAIFEQEICKLYKMACLVSEK